MPRHAPFYFGLAAGIIAFVISLVLVPKFAVSIGANALFVVYLALAAIKLPRLSADYLHAHAHDEDTPAGGIFLVVLIVVLASVVSLFLALNGEQPDAAEVVLSLASVLFGWFTVQAVGAFHYAYEYYQAREASGGGKRQVVGGLDFPGEEEPDGTAFMYFSYTVGTSVATSDTKLTSNAMRRRVTVHLVFSHLYNTIILAAAVNVMMSLGGG
ncbi:DUF1345 domain-containing protein [Devosia sp.]|uniref:DUF1345 domain-containing protein n=1 Tax=Devosia sp. TaxID=1871048 RepID=UPI002FCC6D36